MNPEIKAKWVAALRSGEYKQGRGQLRCADTFCCLGVLCDLHAKETGLNWSSDSKDWYYRGALVYLPPPVVEWSLLGKGSPVVNGEALTFLNDGKKADEDGPAAPSLTFPEIADLIEKHL